MIDSTKRLPNSFLEKIGFFNQPLILKIGPDKVIADYFVDKGAKVTGKDIPEGESTKNTFQANFLWMQRETLFPSKSFHGVWIDECICHIAKKDLLEFFTQVYWILKPEGVFFFNFKVGREESKGNYSTIDGQFPPYSKGEMVDIVESLRFTLVDIGDHPRDILGEKIIPVIFQKN